MRELFLSQIESGAVKTMQPGVFARYWCRLLNAEQITGLSMDDSLSRDQYIKLLSRTLVRRANTFYTHREPMCFYVSFLEERGLLPPGQTNLSRSFGFEDLDCTGMRDRLYYTSINALLNDVDKAIENSANPYDDVYDPAVAILMLAWYGFTHEQIAAVRKSDVTEGGVILDGRLVPIPRPFITRLLRYRDAQGVYSTGRGLIFRKYKPTPLLVRSIGSDSADKYTMRRTINRLNVHADETSPLTYDVVYQSGVYCRAMAAELNGAVISEDAGAESVSALLCCRIRSDAELRAELLNYRHYKKMICA